MTLVSVSLHALFMSVWLCKVPTLAGGFAAVPSPRVVVGSPRGMPVQPQVRFSFRSIDATRLINMSNMDMSKAEYTRHLNVMCIHKDSPMAWEFSRVRKFPGFMDALSMWETKNETKRTKQARERCKMLEASGVTQDYTSTHDIERCLNDLECVRHRASCKCPFTVYCADLHDGSTHAVSISIYSSTGATM